MNGAVTGATETSGDNGLLARMQKLAVSSSKAASRFGAELVVQYSFIDAVLPALNEHQRRQVALAFRREIENVMARTDDVPMPPEYHATLIARVNDLLKWLE
jgi:hypothetical protein